MIVVGTTVDGEPCWEDAVTDMDTADVGIVVTRGTTAVGIGTAATAVTGLENTNMPMFLLHIGA